MPRTQSARTKKKVAKRKNAKKKTENKVSFENIERENEDDVIYDEVTGAKGRRSALSLLNKRVVGSFEMDELFCDWY
jgi:hypothetical protein